MYLGLAIEVLKKERYIIQFFKKNPPPRKPDVLNIYTLYLNILQSSAYAYDVGKD